MSPKPVIPIDVDNTTGGIEDEQHVGDKNDLVEEDEVHEVTHVIDNTQKKGCIILDKPMNKSK